MTKADFYKWVNFHNIERKVHKMTIEENTKTTTFGEFDVGDVFRYGSRYFLKMPNCSIGDYNYNSYDLSNNDYCYFSEYREIIPIKAKLVIE